jgi:hypothetical protein
MEGKFPVNMSEKALPYPFAGGINSAQIQQIDVNGDGREELVVWDRNASNLLDNKANFQMNSQDIPAIMDIDGDGDLDIVSFNFHSGDYLEFYQNTSMERKGIRTLTGLLFRKLDGAALNFVAVRILPLGKLVMEAPFPILLR